jgi:hypothetical protein
MASTIALVEPMLLVAIRLSGTPTWEATLSSSTSFIADQGTRVSGRGGLLSSFLIASPVVWTSAPQFGFATHLLDQIPLCFERVLDLGIQAVNLGVRVWFRLSILVVIVCLISLTLLP